MQLLAASRGAESGQATFTGAMEHVAQAFEALGALILVVGAVWSLWLAVVTWHRTRRPAGAYAEMRQAFGRTILLGLEVLVAADLIRTVAVSPTLENVLTLGLIVLIRTFLSFSLEIEIEGVLPWRRARLRSPATPGTGTSTAPPGEPPDNGTR